MANWKTSDAGIIAESKDGLVTITIDRPEWKNGLNWEGFKALGDAYEKIAEDADARLIVITGTGDYFYTGGRVNASDPEESALYTKYLTRNSTEKAKIHLPMIAAINGDCIKGGMRYVTESDIAIAKKSARFGLPELRMGGVPAVVMATMMDVPKKLMFKAMYSADYFSAEEAFANGMLTEVVEDEAFDETVQKYIDVVMEKPANLVQMTRDMWYAMIDMPDDTTRLEYAKNAFTSGSVMKEMSKVKQEYKL